MHPIHAIYEVYTTHVPHIETDPTILVNVPHNLTMDLKDIHKHYSKVLYTHASLPLLRA